MLARHAAQPVQQVVGPLGVVRPAVGHRHPDEQAASLEVAGRGALGERAHQGQGGGPQPGLQGIHIRAAGVGHRPRLQLAGEQAGVEHRYGAGLDAVLLGGSRVGGPGEGEMVAQAPRQAHEGVPHLAAAAQQPSAALHVAVLGGEEHNLRLWRPVAERNQQSIQLQGRHLAGVRRRLVHHVGHNASRIAGALVLGVLAVAEQLQGKGSCGSNQHSNGAVWTQWLVSQ